MPGPGYGAKDILSMFYIRGKTSLGFLKVHSQSSSLYTRRLAGELESFTGVIHEG